MDPEIRSEFEETHRRIEVVARELRAQAEETRRHFDVATEDMRHDFNAANENVRRHFDVVAEGMQAHVQLVAAETRRHFDVVAEGMRSDVRLVAEGVSSLGERVDRVEENLRQEIRETRRDLTALLTVSYTDLDRRVRRLEGDR